MPIQKIEDLIDSLPKSKSELITEVNANDHFELARLLHQLSPEGKVHVFDKLNSDLKRQEVLYETDLDSRLEIEKSLLEDKYKSLLEEHSNLSKKLEEIQNKEKLEQKKQIEFSEKIDELNQETDTLLEEIDKWQM